MSTAVRRSRVGGAPTVGLGLVVLCALSYAGVSSLQPPLNTTPSPAQLPFTPVVYRACHDDTHLSHNWTHGNPNGGTFGPHNGYYYLKLITPGCVASVDHLTHLVLRVTAAGPVCADPSCPQGPNSRMAPGGVGNPKRTNLANEHPAWGFEVWNQAHTTMLNCTGTYDGTNSSCPGHPSVVANPGNAVVEWRYDGTVSGYIQMRVANNYDEALWEYATADVVACSGCEPESVTPSPTPTPTVPPTATPPPTPESQSSGCSSSRTDVLNGTAAAGDSTSVFIDTSSVGALTAAVTWTPANTAELIVYDAGTLTVLSKQTGSSGALTSSIDNLPAAAYKVKVHDDGNTAITFTLAVTHC